MLNLLNDQSSNFKRLVAIIDGEHYPQITLDAIEVLKKEFAGEFCGIIFLGGTEKITTGNFADFFNDKVSVMENFTVDFPAALDRFKPDLVYDLSDEPVVNHRIRMTIASFCFFKHASYMGPDFFFRYEKKSYKTKSASISIIGTGKRIGKTAISSFVSRIFKNNHVDVIIVAMGRGGPRNPQLLRGEEISIDPEYLLSLSSKGLHASSDYIEDAMMSRITTIGCRRCGGGFGGRVFLSNVSEGAELADSLNPDLIILEGSGASVPEVQTSKTICVVGANQNWDEITGYLGIYRILMSDLVILTNCEKPLASRKEINNLENNIKAINPSAAVYRSIFRPEPLGCIENKKVVVAMTAKSIINDKIKKYIEKKFNCTVVGITFNLSNRPLLKKDLETYNDYDTILTELKAASVDVVTDFALKSGREVIYMNNICEIPGGSKTFENNLLQLFRSIKS